jgi:hypothetical protein
MITLFILIYLVSLAIHLIMCYREDRRIIFTVGDFIDEIDFYMWCPILNTFMLIAYALCACIVAIWELTKLSILWEKFRNIRLK